MGKPTIDSNPRPHVFTLSSPPASHMYQICDVRYPRIDKYVNDTAHLLPEANHSHGWFHKAVYRRIHSILFDKYHSLLDRLRAQRSHEIGVTGAPLAWSRFNIVPMRRRTKESDDNMSDTDIETLISNEKCELMAPDVRHHPAAYPMPALAPGPDVPSVDQAPVPDESIYSQFVPDPSQVTLFQTCPHLLKLDEEQAILMGNYDNFDEYDGEYEDVSEFEYYDGASEEESESSSESE